MVEIFRIHVKDKIECVRHASNDFHLFKVGHNVVNAAIPWDLSTLRSEPELGRREMPASLGEFPSRR